MDNNSLLTTVFICVKFCNFFLSAPQQNGHAYLISMEKLVHRVHSCKLKDISQCIG